MPESHSRESLRKPDSVSSFEFRGETIKVEWFDIESIEDLPDIPFKQVYAIGNVDGKVPVVHYAGEDQNDNLPGGTIEEGETIGRALERELIEEANMRVLSWKPIGYQKLTNPVLGTEYQLRVYAELESIGKFVSDPGGGVVGNSLVELAELNSRIRYGDVGDRIVGLVAKFFGTNNS